MQTWASLSNRKADLVQIHLTPDNESSELIGQIQPYSFMDLINSLPRLGALSFQRYAALKKIATLASTGSIEEETRNIIEVLLPIEIEKLRKIQHEQTHLPTNESSRFESNNLVFTADSKGSEEQACIGDIISSDSDFLAHISSTQDSVFDIPFQTDSWLVNEDGFEILNYDYNKNIDALSDEFAGDGFSNTADDGFGTTDDGFGSTAGDGFSATIDDGFGNITTEDGFGNANNEFGATNTGDGFGTTNDDGLASGETTQFNDDTIHSEVAITQGTQADVLPADVASDGFSTATSDFDLFSDPLIKQLKLKDSLFADVRTDRLKEQERPIWSAMKQKVETLIANMNKLCKLMGINDATLQQMIKKLDSTWLTVSNEHTDRSKPIFLFQDGPVTKAAKLGQLLLLEDFNLPSQAVMERMNSMFEPSPTFSVMEDITLQSLNSQTELDITLPETFQVFATVHQETEFTAINLSPATRSRFTEIRVLPYGADDLKFIARVELQARLPATVTAYIPNITSTLLQLREAAVTNPQWTEKQDVSRLFRCIDFICNQSNRSHDSVTYEYYEQLVYMAARFFYFDEFKLIEQETVFKRWWESRGLSVDDIPKETLQLFREPTQETGAWEGEMIDELPSPFVVLANGDIKLRYPFFLCI